MRITDHATEQCETRGLDVRLVAAKALVSIPESFRGDAAVKVEQLSRHHVEANLAHFDGPSNGDVVVAIVRGGTLKTVMFRRSSQPFTADALRVDGTFVYQPKEAVA